MSIRVVIVDDHRIVRRGVRAILDEDIRFSVVGEAASGAEAVRVVAETQPDAVLLDIKLPDFGGVALCQQVLDACPETAVLILTAYINRELVGACLRAGARGYLLKEAENLDLCEQLSAAVLGHTALDPRAADVLVDFMRQHEPPPDALSARQIEVLRYLALGWTNRQIGDALCISENTVKGHVKAILAKLGVHNRVEALVVAQNRGLF